MSYRPRGSLARTLYNKWSADEQLRQFDKDQWYAVDIQYVPRCLRSTFVKLGVDAETELFLQQSVEKSSWVWTQIWHVIVKALLGSFLTQTSINGLLERGSMFVFSREQLEILTTPVNLKCMTSTPRRLLDLGAGDGEVTSVFAAHFDEVYVTEMSRPMQRKLRSKGFHVLDVETWSQQEMLKFDVIMCLNLLDRCNLPENIIRDMKRALTPGGIVIIALVLPFKPYVEVGSPTHLPVQKLNITGERFEDQVNSLVHNVIVPEGFSVVRWSRVPYLCEGDLAQSYYWLDDVILVLKLDQTVINGDKNSCEAFQDG